MDNVMTHPQQEGSDVVHFAQLELDGRILRAVEQLGFETPTPIQQEAIPELMARRDIIGGARTGSGKTAAFGLPLIHHLREGGNQVRALILAPTRELAKQVSDALNDYAKHTPVKITTIYGGVGYREQLRALKSGVTVVVGTPGRVLDHMKRGSLVLDHLEMLVLDEADEMLQMGFLEDVETVLEAAPDERQVALFSATMPEAIRRVAERYLNEPVRVQVESAALKTEHIDQRWVRCKNREKTDVLMRILMSEKRDATLIFARTRAGCAELAEKLMNRGFSVDALHGDMSQSARELVLARLRANQVRVVVATDVAARGLDVDHITHVINYDMPENSETYVHRIGRTARAGRKGWAITFVANHQKGRLQSLQRELKHALQPMSIPSNAQVAEASRYQLEEAIAVEMERGDQYIEAWLDDVLARREWDAKQLALAAIKMVAESKQVDFRPPEAHKPERQDKRPKKQFKPDTPEQEEHFARVNEVELFFPVGRRDGLRPADFVGALCNEGGLTSDLIGRITMGSHKAFVGLPLKVAETLIAHHGDLIIRGDSYPLRLSKQSPGHEVEAKARYKHKNKSKNQRQPFGGKKKNFKKKNKNKGFKKKSR